MGRFFILRSRVQQEYNGLLPNALNRILKAILQRKNLRTKNEPSGYKYLFMCVSKLEVFTQYPGGGGTWVFLGWVCAARDSKLAPRSRKNFP